MDWEVLHIEAEDTATKGQGREPNTVIYKGCQKFQSLNTTTHNGYKNLEQPIETHHTLTLGQCGIQYTNSGDPVDFAQCGPSKCQCESSVVPNIDTVLI
jgi:hypothetical protein